MKVYLFIYTEGHKMIKAKYGATKHASRLENLFKISNSRKNTNTYNIKMKNHTCITNNDLNPHDHCAIDTGALHWPTELREIKKSIIEGRDMRQERYN